MKRFLTVLISVILTLVMGITLMACETSKEAVSLSRLFDGLDLNNGFTVNFNAEVEVEQISAKVGGVAKAKIENNQLMLDAELEMDGEDMPEVANAYIRGNEIYSGYAENKSDEIIYEIDTLENGGMDFNAIWFEYLPASIESMGKNPLLKLADDEVKFKKSGDTYKADIDVMAKFNEFLNKTEKIVKDFAIDTTVGDLYKKLEIKKTLKNAYGNTTMQEMYEALRPQLESLIAAYPSRLPDNIDDLIDILRAETGYNFPKVGNKKVADYIDELIKPYKNKTVGEILLLISGMDQGLSGAERLEVLKEIKEGIEEIKEQVLKLITQIKEVLPRNTFKIALVADKEGRLSRMTLDFALDQSIIELFGFRIFAAAPASNNAFLTANVQIDIEYSASDFVDESTLLTPMRKIAGTYKFVKMTGIDYNTESPETKEFNLGDELRGEILTENSVIMILNEDGTGTITFNLANINRTGDLEWLFNRWCPHWIDGMDISGFQINQDGTAEFEVDIFAVEGLMIFNIQLAK